MLAYNEIKEKKVIIYEDEPCEVVESHVARTQQRKPQNQVKLRSLLSGKTFAATFHVSDKAEEADVSRREIKFLYANKPARTTVQSGGGEFWFCYPNDPSNRFKLPEDLIGSASKFLKQNMIVTASVFSARGGSASGGEDEEKIIKISLPIKLEFLIKDAPPAVKGDTAKGGTKQAILENGTTINVPLFINPGDKIIINTESEEYVERM
ncbi:MAG: Elongation factor P [Candidatus Nomurabacteria bacterium GW2011_GWB1_37_5]|uniref:Elongation factor P n=1 Tax=Candidatus Nomurabacteria bacterium GW2011_GWB1_37_5 TaxID=1618742 RepID=A0A0G0GWT9_9BACT|nr:MAG: Elongation factor P [Candidatus Nomurabacteria bacterium GW2011_GWB1_37_5]